MNSTLPTLTTDVLGLIMAYAENDRDIGALANSFLDGESALPQAHATIYGTYQGQPKTLMGRMIHQLENSPLQVAPNGFSFKLQAVREQAVEHLLQNRLWMREAWTPVLAGRQIGELPYRELNELGRPLQEKRDQNLIAFMDLLRPLYPFIQDFLNSINHLSPDEKAERLRTWMAEKRTQLEAIDTTGEIIFSIFGIMFNFPLEVYYFSPGVKAIALSSWLLSPQTDTGAIIQILRQPWPNQETKSQIVKQIAINLVNKGDLEAFTILNERGMFADLSDDLLNAQYPLEGMNPGEQNGPEPEHLAVIKAAIELPSIGFLFLLLNLTYSIRAENWDEVEALLLHPKMHEITHKQLPAVYDLARS